MNKCMTRFVFIYFQFVVPENLINVEMKFKIRIQCSEASIMQLSDA